MQYGEYGGQRRYIIVDGESGEAIQGWKHPRNRGNYRTTSEYNYKVTANKPAHFITLDEAHLAISEWGVSYAKPAAVHSAKATEIYDDPVLVLVEMSDVSPADIGWDSAVWLDDSISLWRKALADGRVELSLSGGTRNMIVALLGRDTTKFRDYFERLGAEFVGMEFGECWWRVMNPYWKQPILRQVISHTDSWDIPILSYDKFLTLGIDSLDKEKGGESVMRPRGVRYEETAAGDAYRTALGLKLDGQAGILLLDDDDYYISDNDSGFWLSRHSQRAQFKLWQAHQRASKDIRDDLMSIHSSHGGDFGNYMNRMTARKMRDVLDSLYDLQSIADLTAVEEMELERLVRRYTDTDKRITHDMFDDTGGELILRFPDGVVRNLAHGNRQLSHTEISDMLLTDRYPTTREWVPDARDADNFGADLVRDIINNLGIEKWQVIVWALAQPRKEVLVMTGASNRGKSTLFQMLSSIGWGRVTSIPDELIGTGRVPRFGGVVKMITEERLLVFDEASSSTPFRINDTRLKYLRGAYTLNVEEKHKEAREVRKRGTMMMLSNQPVVIDALAEEWQGQIIAMEAPPMCDTLVLGALREDNAAIYDTERNHPLRVSDFRREDALDALNDWVITTLQDVWSVQAGDLPYLRGSSESHELCGLMTSAFKELISKGKK